MKHICSQSPSHRLTASQAAAIVPSRTQQLPKAHTASKATQDEPVQMLTLSNRVNPAEHQPQGCTPFLLRTTQASTTDGSSPSLPRQDAQIPSDLKLRGELVMCSVAAAVPRKSTRPLQYLGQDLLSPKAFLCIRIPHNLHSYPSATSMQATAC